MSIFCVQLMILRCLWAWFLTSRIGIQAWLMTWHTPVWCGNLLRRQTDKIKHKNTLYLHMQKHIYPQRLLRTSILEETQSPVLVQCHVYKLGSTSHRLLCTDHLKTWKNHHSLWPEQCSPQEVPKRPRRTIFHSEWSLSVDRTRQTYSLFAFQVFSFFYLHPLA